MRGCTRLSLLPGRALRQPILPAPPPQLLLVCASLHLQLVCVADEFRGNPQLQLRAIQLVRQRSGQQEEVELQRTAAPALGTDLGPASE